MDVGLKMIDIETQFHAITAAWIPKCIKFFKINATWTIFPSLYLNKISK